MTNTTGIAYGSAEYVELLHKLRAELSLRADQLYTQTRRSALHADPGV